MTLDPRKIKILQAIIDEYIANAVPIGSRTISKKEGICCSSATIRNEMSDLEELGFLDQPHTSAGRVPSNKAYRLYVDNMIRNYALSIEEMQYIQSYFDGRMNDVEHLVKQTAKILSNITSYMSVALPPTLKRVTVQHVQLVPVTLGRTLLLVVTDVGILKDVLMKTPESMDTQTLENVSRMITETVKGKTVDEARLLLGKELDREMMSHRQVIRDVFAEVEKNMTYTAARDVVLEGTMNMLAHPEYNDVGKLKSFLSMVESRDVLFDMLSKATRFEISVTIGEENEYEDLKDCSVVTATYRIGGYNIGSLGVIGPTRMNYQKAIAVLGYLGKSLSMILTDLSQQDDLRLSP
ncbi:MAG: heat-inducible transcriptional repressor HrcA [Christensenellales bacterium]